MTAQDKTLIQMLAELPEQARREVLASMSEEDMARLAYYWPAWARKDQLPPPGDWYTWLFLAGRGAGKALDVDTPIPTPSGFKRMGDLEAGDAVYDERGQPCKVVAAHPVMHWRTCYRVHFSGGVSLVADAEHLWLTMARRVRHPGDDPDSPPGRVRVRTTEEIMRTLEAQGPNCQTRKLNHAVPAIQPIVGNTRVRHTLPPYALGVWLGDGRSHDGRLCLSTRDMEAIIAGLHECGVTVEKLAYQKTESCTEFSAHYRGESFYTILQRMRLLRRKHIPKGYLFAPEEDRRALLRGIMDTDGYVCRRGIIEISLSDERLAKDVHALICSLGYTPSLSRRPAGYKGKRTLHRWRMVFTARKDDGICSVPFRLERMPTSVADRGGRGRLIVDVEPVETRPVRCITVDSPSRLYLAGRAFIPTHNTRAAAEWVRMIVDSGKYERIALVGEDAGDVRDVMVEGESGLLSVFPPWQRPKYEPSKRRITFHNGAIATVFSADDPESLRGPQHHAAWIDELAKFRYAQEVYDQLQFGLRLGALPRQVITTTPRPIKTLMDIMQDPSTVITRASTYDNLHNLSPRFRDAVLRKYEGTFLGRQEILGEVLTERPGALFPMRTIEANRIQPDAVPEMEQIVVAVDPPASSSGAECGIIVAGRAGAMFYVLDDLSMQGSPEAWASRVIAAYEQHEADAIVAEVNQGGDMVASTIRAVAGAGAGHIPIKQVRATRGKVVRAQPVAALYEQGRVRHVGTLPTLESQMVAFEPDGTSGGVSPDRVDAMVWAITYLDRTNAQAAPVGVAIA